MSEQIDGFLEMKASHGFDRNKISGYRSKTIEPHGFQQWTKDNMYKSSYAHFHSKVSHLSFRTLLMAKIVLFQDMEATYLPLKHKIFMLRDTHQWQNKVSIKINLVKIHLDFLQQDSISTEPTLLIQANLPQVINMERQKSKEPIQDGM